MNNPTKTHPEAVTLIRQGQKNKPVRSCLRASKPIRADEIAWLWLAETAENDDQRLRVLARCLKLIPTAGSSKGLQPSARQAGQASCRGWSPGRGQLSSIPLPAASKRQLRRQTQPVVTRVSTAVPHRHSPSPGHLAKSPPNPLPNASIPSL